MRRRPLLALVASLPGAAGSQLIADLDCFSCYLVAVVYFLYILLMLSFLWLDLSQDAAASAPDALPFDPPSLQVIAGHLWLRPLSRRAWNWETRPRMLSSLWLAPAFGLMVPPLLWTNEADGQLTPVAVVLGADDGFAALEFEDIWDASLIAGACGWAMSTAVSFVFRHSGSKAALAPDGAALPPHLPAFLATIAWVLCFSTYCAAGVVAIVYTTDYTSARQEACVLAALLGAVAVHIVFETIRAFALSTWVFFRPAPDLTGGSPRPKRGVQRVDLEVGDGPSGIDTFDDGTGVCFGRTIPGGVADRAGLPKTFVLLRVQGTPVTSVEDAAAAAMLCRSRLQTVITVEYRKMAKGEALPAVHAPEAEAARSLVEPQFTEIRVIGGADGAPVGLHFDGTVLEDVDVGSPADAAGAHRCLGLPLTHVDGEPVDAADPLRRYEVDGHVFAHTLRFAGRAPEHRSRPPSPGSGPAFLPSTFPQIGLPSEAMTAPPGAPGGPPLAVGPRVEAVRLGVPPDGTPGRIAAFGDTVSVFWGTPFGGTDVSAGNLRLIDDGSSGSCGVYVRPQPPACKGAAWQTAAGRIGQLVGFDGDTALVCLPPPIGTLRLPTAALQLLSGVPPSLPETRRRGRVAPFILPLERGEAPPDAPPVPSAPPLSPYERRRRLESAIDGLRLDSKPGTSDGQRRYVVSRPQLPGDRRWGDAKRQSSPVSDAAAADAPPPPLREQPPTPLTLQEFRQCLSQFYAFHNPAKMQSVDDALQRAHTSPQGAGELLKQLSQTYPRAAFDGNLDWLSRHLKAQLQGPAPERKLPQALRIRAPSVPEAEGLYVLTRGEVAGRPVWTRGGFRVAVDAGCWAVGPGRPDGALAARVLAACDKSAALPHLAGLWTHCTQGGPGADPTIVVGPAPMPPTGRSRGHHDAPAPSPKPASQKSGSALSSDAGKSVGVPELQRVILSEHARLRSLHGSPPLTFSESCASCAQQQADACKQEGRVFHGHDEKQGQNAFCVPNTGQSDAEVAKAAAEAWYSELREPGWKTGTGFSPGTGHFTQLVWKETKEVGAAIARTDEHVFLIANYFPPGNDKEDFSENVCEPVEKV